MQSSLKAEEGNVPLPRITGLSIVIPCYNEEKTLARCLERVLSIRGEDLALEIVIVDDCSRDRSREIAEEFVSRYPEIRLVRHEKNQGKGAALQSGFKIVTHAFVGIQDSDLEYNPEEFRKLLIPLLRDQADVVIGSRFLGGSMHRVLYYWHSLGNRFLTTLSNMLTDLNLTDMETCYKVFKREVIQGLDLKEKRFGFEPEVVAKIAQERLRIFEVGISYSGRTYAEGKKINWRDGVRALYCILKYNLPKVPGPIQFLFYLVIGGTCALINLAVFLGLLRLGLQPVFSALSAFAVAAAVNYRLSTAFLFRSGAQWRPWQEIVIYVVAVSLIGLVDAFGTKALLHLGVSPISAKLAMTAIGLVLNFLARKHFVFYERPNPDWNPSGNLSKPAR